MRASSIDHRVRHEAAEASAALKPVWQRLLDRAIDFFFVLWMFLATGAMVPLMVGGQSSYDLTADDRGILRLLTVGPVLLVGPLLIVSRAKAIIILLLRNPALLLLLLWVWCSVLWSVAPDISMRRALILTVSSLLACYWVVRHDLDWILKKSAWLFLTLLLAAVLFILFVPSLSVMPGGERGLRAIFTHKNGMGQLLIMAVVLLPPAIEKRLVHPVLGSAGLLVALALLVPVQSATAIIVVFLVLASRVAIAVWRLPARLAAAVTAFGVAVACLVTVATYINLNAIFELLGRDLTLTGRTELWRYVWQVIEQRPVTGYGYGAFFQVEDQMAYVTALFPWEPPNTHNGYLELLLDLGIVGFALFMAFIGSGLVRLTIASKKLDRESIGFLLTLVVAQTSRAITEANTLPQYGSLWVLVVISMVSLTPNLAAIRGR